MVTIDLNKVQKPNYLLENYNKRELFWIDMYRNKHLINDMDKGHIVNIYKFLLRNQSTYTNAENVAKFLNKVFKLKKREPKPIELIW